MTTAPALRIDRTARAAGGLAPHALGGVWAALIATIPFFDFYFRKNYEGVGLYQATPDMHANGAVTVTAGAALLAAAAVSVCAVLIMGVDYRRLRGFFILTLLMVVFATLSSMTADAPTMPLIVAALVVALLMAANFGAVDRWETLFLPFAVVTASMFTAAELLAVFSHDYTWGRLGGHAGPNYWGMAAGSAIVLCLAVRPAPLRIPIVVVALVTLYLAQARGSEVGTVCGVSAMLGVKLVRTPMRRSVFWCVAGAIAIVVFASVFSDQIAKRILLLNDPARGAASHGSGRLVGWGETLNIIAAHPMFGVGLRQHEKFLRAVGNAHNAYLAVTAEQGLVGLTFYVVLYLGGLIRAVMAYLRSPGTGRIIIVGFMAFFVSLGMFEQVSLATGNAYTLVMFIVTALAWRGDASPARTQAARRSDVLLSSLEHSR